MKIKLSRKNGSVLVVALVIAGVVGLALLSYLSLTSSQNMMTARSEAWNSAMPLVEAGVEDAIAHITANPKTWASAGWKGKQGLIELQRTLGEGHYTVTVSNREQPTIIARGFVPAPLSSGFISRTVRVLLIMKPQIGPGMGAKGTIEMNGNKLYVDSFDSSDPAYSTLLGMYDPKKHKAGVTVASNLGLVDAIDSGNADIWGKVATGPGGTINSMKNGVIGDAAWHATSTGIQPSSVSNDADLPFPPIIAPVSGNPAPINLLGNIVLGTGVYEIGSLTANVVVNGDATLIVRNVFDLKGADAIKIAPGGSLKLYVYAANATFGPGSYNYLNGGKAENLYYYGMPSNTAVTFNGNTSFVGVLYAPDARFRANGGGSGLNFCGSAMTKSVEMQGSYSFHFDEALLKLADEGFVISRWDEI